MKKGSLGLVLGEFSMCFGIQLRVRVTAKGKVGSRVRHPTEGDANFLSDVAPGWGEGSGEFRL